MRIKGYITNRYTGYNYPQSIDLKIDKISNFRLDGNYLLICKEQSEAYAIAMQEMVDKALAEKWEVL